jgi:hypothetical protein
VITPLAISDDVCNLCCDPACPRRKGQPHRLCIGYRQRDLV